MLQYGVNLSMLFTEYPLAERVRRTAELGFPSFEFLFPRQFDMAELCRLQQQYGLTVQLFDPDVPAEGPYMRGYLAMPGDEAESAFFRSLEEALVLAGRTGTRLFNTLCGLRLPELSKEEQTELLVGRLRKAAPLAASAGVTLLVEAINPISIPDYFLNYSQDAFAIVDAVGEPNVKFQYDVFHMQIVEGNLTETITNNLDKIAHIQIADVPGRHEPGTGEINYPYLLHAVEEAGYGGYVGLEYTPSGRSEDSFAWWQALRQT